MFLTYGDSILIGLCNAGMGLSAAIGAYQAGNTIQVILTRAPKVGHGWLAYDFPGYALPIYLR